jgi:hypothetical protein
MLEFHPAAAKALNERGQKIVSAIAKQDFRQQQNEFHSERPIAASLTDSDIVGEIILGHSDPITGHQVARFFPFSGYVFGLVEQDYVALRQLTETILKEKRFSNLVSLEFVEAEIFSWCRDRYCQATTEFLSDRLAARINSAVKPVTIWYPVAHMEVETSFSLGPVEVKPISGSLLDKWEFNLTKVAPEDAKENVNAFFQRLRGKVVGLAAVVVTTSAEQGHAYATGPETADIAIGFMRFFHFPSLTPWKTSSVALLGSEHIPKAEGFIFHDGPAFGHISGVRDTRWTPWQLSNSELSGINNAGLAQLGDLIIDDNLSEFQSRVRNSVLTYSKGAAIPNLNDRLVYTCSALEGLLLVDGSEPIQYNLSDRMAFLTEKDPERRHRVVRVVKDAYKLRSQYVHHMVSMSEAETLQEFFTSAWRTIQAAILQPGQFKTTIQFIAAIDKVKLGG